MKIANIHLILFIRKIKYPRKLWKSEIREIEDIQIRKIREI